MCNVLELKVKKAMLADDNAKRHSMADIVPHLTSFSLLRDTSAVCLISGMVTVDFNGLVNERPSDRLDIPESHLLILESDLYIFLSLTLALVNSVNLPAEEQSL